MIKLKKPPLLVVGFLIFGLMAVLMMRYIIPIQAFVAIPLDYSSGICPSEAGPSEAKFHYVRAGSAAEYFRIKRDIENNSGIYSLRAVSPGINVSPCQKTVYKLYLL